MLRAVWRLGLVGAVVLSPLGCIVTKPPEAPGAEAAARPLRVVALADGLRVVLEQAPDFGEAGAVLVVGAGSADEPASQAGLAHLTEHMAFDGKHAGVSLRDMQRELGSTANANTDWDETAYFAFDDPTALEAIVRFMYGVATEPMAGADQATFEREWHAVANEMRMRTERGTPGQAVGMLMTATFPAGHPYAHPVVATPESLSRLAFEDVRDFAAALYHPERCTLVVSAPLPLHEQQALLERATGQHVQTEILGVRAPQPRPPVPTLSPRSFEVRDAEVQTPTLWIGWITPSGFGRKADLASLLATVLESSFRFDRDPDVAYLDASVFPGTAAGLFSVEVALKEGAHPERTASLIASELSAGLGNLAQWDVSLEAITRFAATHYVCDDENMIPRAVRLARSYHETG